MLDSRVSKEEKSCLRWRHCWQVRDYSRNFMKLKLISASMLVSSICLSVCVCVSVCLFPLYNLQFKRNFHRTSHTYI